MSGFAQAKAASSPLPSTQWSSVMPLWRSPAWLADTQRALSRLAELNAGWDGSGSPAPQSMAIGAASRLLDELDAYCDLPTPSVGPVAGGGLGLEWRNGSRDLDLEFLPDGTIEFLKSEKKPSGLDVKEMEDGLIPSDNPREAKKLIRWLMGY
jgi:hypothetical protein